jgi:hypothetical protein
MKAGAKGLRIDDAASACGARARVDLDGVGFAAQRDAYDEAVAQSPSIDQFCSSSAWVLPAHAAFHSDHPVVACRIDDGFVALARGYAPELGRFLAPLEAMWGLASPIVGADERGLAQGAAEWLLADPDWNLLWLGGLMKDGPAFTHLVRFLGPRVQLRLGPSTVRYRASLDGGLDGWSSRRSPVFRKRLRQAMRWAKAELTFEWVDGAVAFDAPAAAAMFQRIHAVETRSWKGREGTGFVMGDMYRFYERMVPSLALKQGASGHALRVLFARQGERDVAVCFGGVFGDTYRGLQNSFDDDFRSRSLGNVMQAESIARLCHEGISIYDLGSEMDYKARWAESALETVTLLVIRRP